MKDLPQPKSVLFDGTIDKTRPYPVEKINAFTAGADPAKEKEIMSWEDFGTHFRTFDSLVFVLRTAFHQEYGKGPAAGLS